MNNFNTILFMLTINFLSVVFSRDVTLSCGPDDAPSEVTSGPPGKRGPIGLSGVKGEKGNQGDPGETTQTYSGSFAASCLDLREDGETNSGIFTIRPNPNSAEFPTFCDMTSGGGGWTLVASVHENNIDGKCTVGDKWSSEQGIEPSTLEVQGSWTNFETFGDIESVTSADYKNPAYFNLQATNIMLWHVPNNVNIKDIENQAFLKYFTSDGLLGGNETNLRYFFSYTSPMQRVPMTNGRFALIDMPWVTSLRRHVPNFFPYSYDGDLPTHIHDGGHDMYDDGNKVSFQVDSNSYTEVRYGEVYGRVSSGYLATSAMAHPFIFLAWISPTGVDSFRIRVTSNVGADGKGELATYQGSFENHHFTVRYRIFHIYNADDPSICEVYFHIVNSREWKSVEPLVDFPKWTIAGTDQLLNEMHLRRSKNILAGYILLSRLAALQIFEHHVVAVLNELVDGVKDLPLAALLTFSIPVTFAKGNITDVTSRVPTSEIGDVSAGYVDLKALDNSGYPYALCPGVRVKPQGDPSLHCIGGINSNADGRNAKCGDFADWNRGNAKSKDRPSATGRALNDIQSTILIFTRNGQ